MTWFRIILLSVAVALVAGGTFAGRQAHATGVPENVVIVVNADSWVSRGIANEYRSLRGIPAANLIEVDGLSNFERISVHEFRTRILNPVLTAIADRGLEPQIDYVLYSADLPTAIDIRTDLVLVQVHPIFTPVASINGLTFLHQFVRENNASYLSFEANHYARRIVNHDTPWTLAEQQRAAETMQRWQQHQKHVAEAGQTKPDDARADPTKAAETAKETEALLETTLESLRDLEKAHPRSLTLLYRIACFLARQGKTDEAMKKLEAAVAAGSLNFQNFETDPELRPLRARPDYKAWFEKLRDTPIDIQPTTGFQSRIAWTVDGEPLASDSSAPDGQDRPEAAPAGPSAPPRRYLLSTVLACTRGRGLTFDEAVENLRRSVAADGSRPSGTIYLESNGDVRSRVREWAFRDVARRLKALGVQAVVESGVLPKDRADVAGAVIGAPDFTWSSSGSTILPGAIVEHVTSFGGVMTKGAGQTPLVEFLRHGAAGASGTVTEPNLAASLLPPLSHGKFPMPFLQVFYAEGCTLAESFYQSIVGPYQLLIVGDALCRPWARPFTLTVSGQPADAARLAEPLELIPRCESSAGIALAESRLYVDGRLVQTADAGTPLALDPASLDGGAHEATVVAVGDDAVRSVARRSFRFITGDPARSCHAKLAGEGPLAWEETGRMMVSAEGATSIEVRWGTRTLGRVEGSSGEVTLDPNVIGPGLVPLEAVAAYPDGSSVRAASVELRVLTPRDTTPPEPKKN